MIPLDEFLNDLAFDYKINKELKTISLIDELRANLGNIETEEFEINENLPMILVDRLDTYIFDYHISGIIETLRYDCQYEDDVFPYDKKLIKVMKQYPNHFNEDLIQYIKDIIEANINITKLIEELNQ